ncbi:MAG TPA: hypothetical protein VIF14_15655, partial [Alphaproteobacteria bacterium]
MPGRFSILIVAAALVACSGNELRAPISGPPARFLTYGNEAQPRGQVTGVASNPSFEMDAPPVAEVGNLCTYRTRKDPVMQGYSDRSGAQWEGEIHVRDLPSLDPKWFSPSDKRMATMVARPRVAVFRARIDDNCYNAATKTYAACTKVLETDLSRVRGFARALTLERAGALAVQLCEKKVAELVDKSTEIRQENIDLRCHVFEQAFCELP